MIAVALSLIWPVFARDRIKFFDSLPGPRLIYPASDKVILGGEDFLEFKWITRDLFDADYYDFRLYKGYDMLAGNLIFKERIPASDSTIQIKSSLFENGQVYTLSLRVVVTGGQKSDRSFVSFKIIKNN